MAYIGSTPAPQMPEVGTGAVETQDIQDGAVTAAKLAPGAAVPSQTGNSAKYLTTDGTTSSWGLAVASFNTRTGAVTLSSGDVTGALGFTPYNSTNPTGYITSSALSSYLTSATAASTYQPIGSYLTGITSSQVTTALGFTPYNSTNPSGYISSITSGNVTTALGFTPENSANRGTANGYASLDGSGLVPSTQLPSYVDDVLEYANLAGFPATGTTGKIYVAIDTNKTYRWSGSAYVYITSGAVDSVAGKTGVVSLTSSDVGLGSVENKSSATIRSEISSANVTTALGFTPYNSTNPSGYITGITSANVTSALGYTPYNSSNPSGYITGITSANVTSALGFTPYNSSNPSGYITSSALSSYAPLTGTGTSGTWGINVTGYSNYVNRVTNYVWSNATLPSGYNSGIETSFVSGAEGWPNYGVVLSVMGRIPADPGGNFQLYMGHGTSYGGLGLRVRSINQANNLWTSWKILLDETNYTSYAMPAGASATNSVDIRAPIFYDSDNTAYYTNPATTSNFFDLGITGASHKYLYLNPGNGYEAMVRYNGGSGSGWYVGKRTASVIVGTESFHFYSEAAGATVAGIDTGGNSFSSTSYRAPVFYDLDNTGYYLNPASSSVLDSVTVNSITGYVNGLSSSGNNISGMGTATTWDARPQGIYDRYAINWHTGISLSGYPSYGGVRLYSAGYPTLNSSTLRLEASTGVYTYGQLTNDNRIDAPIFYDYNNTAYYVNPNSTSVLNALTVADVTAGSLISTSYVQLNGPIYRAGPGTGYMNGQYPSSENTTTSGPIYSIGGSYVPTATTLGNMYGIGFTYAGVTGGAGALTASSSWGLYVATNGTARVFLDSDIGRVLATGDMRAPIFYDSTDTSYFADPNSTSSFNVIKSYDLRYQGGVGDNNTWGMHFDNAGSNAYAIYRAAGAWTHPYPDLRIAFHTGIQIGANASYGGVRFYDDYDMTTEVMSVNYAAVGLGANNVYVNNSLVAGADLRAPLFYDSNNTGYYVDPNGTTNLNALNINGVAVTAGGGGAKPFAAFNA